MIQGQRALSRRTRARHFTDHRIFAASYVLVLIAIAIATGCGKGAVQSVEEGAARADAKRACEVWRKVAVDLEGAKIELRLKLDEQAVSFAQKAAQTSPEWGSFATAATDFLALARALTVRDDTTGTAMEGYEVAKRGIAARDVLREKCKTLGVDVF